MKKSLRVLSLVLSVVMIFSSLTVGASAATYRGDASTVLSSVTYDDVDTATYTTEQYATMALDEVDRMLEEANLGTINAYVVEIDLSSIDGVLGCIPTVINKLDSLSGYLGKEKGGDLVIAALKELVTTNSDGTYTVKVGRNTGTDPDTNIIYTLLDVIAKLAPVAQLYINGGLNLGLVQSFISDYVFDVRQLAVGMLIQLSGLGGEDFNYIKTKDEETTKNLVEKYNSQNLIVLGQQVFNKYILGEWKQLDGSDWLFYDDTHKTNVNAYSEIIWLDESGNDVSSATMDTTTYDYYAWVHPDCWVTKGLGNGVRVKAGSDAPDPSYDAVNFVKIINSSSTANKITTYQFVENAFVQAYNGILVPVLNRITTRWINDERGYKVDENKTKQYLDQKDAEGKAIPNADFDYMYIGDTKSAKEHEATSSAFTLFKEEIKVPQYTLSTVSANYTTFIEAFNDNLGTFASTVLDVTGSVNGSVGTYTYTDSSNKSYSFDWTYGGNGNLVNNVCNVLKFLLYATGEEFFDSGIIERGEYKTAGEIKELGPQALISYVLRGVINTNVDYIYIPASADTSTIAGVAMEACVQLAYQDLPQFTYTAVKSTDYQVTTEYYKAVVERCLNILMDVAAYNLNSVLDTNLNSHISNGIDYSVVNDGSTNNTGLLSYLGDEGDWTETAKTIAAWAVYTWASTTVDGNAKCLLALDLNSDNYGGASTGLTIDAVWDDLENLVNAIVPIKTVAGASESKPDNRPWIAAEIAEKDNVIESIIFDYIIYPILGLDVTNLQTLLSENSKGALAYDNIETILVDTVHRVFDLIFPDVFDNSIGTINDFVQNTALSNMVYDLISTLSANYNVDSQANNGSKIYGRGKIITGVALPIVCLALGLSDKQEFNELEIYLDEAVKAADSIDVPLHNSSSGVNTSYRDPSTFDRQADELYEYVIQTATAKSLIKNAAVSIDSSIIGQAIPGGDTANAVLKGATTAGDMIQLTFTYKVKDETGDAYIQTADNNGDATFSKTQFVYIGESAKGDDETLIEDNDNSAYTIKYASDIYLGAGDKLTDLDNYSFQIISNAEQNLAVEITGITVDYSNGTKDWLTANTSASDTDIAKANGGVYIYNPITTDAAYQRTAYTYQKDANGSVLTDDYGKSIRVGLDTEGGKNVTNGTYPITVNYTVGGTAKSFVVTAHLYDDYGLESLVNSCVSANLSIDNIDESKTIGEVTGQAAWGNYTTALQNAAGLALQPNNNHDGFDTYIGLTDAGTISESSKYKTYYEALYAAREALEPYKVSSGAKALWDTVNGYLPYNYRRTEYEVTDSSGTVLGTVNYKDYLDYNETDYGFVGQRNYMGHTYRLFKSYVNKANDLINKQFKWSKTPEEYKNMTDEEKATAVEEYNNDVADNTDVISAVDAAYITHMLKVTYSRLIKANTYTTALAAVLDNKTLQKAGNKAFSVSSEKAYDNAVTFAQSVLNSDSPTPEQVTRAITEYIYAWKKLTAAADYTNLETAVKNALEKFDADGYVYTDYVPESIEDGATLEDNPCTLIDYDNVSSFYDGEGNRLYTDDSLKAFVAAVNKGIELLYNKVYGSDLGTGDQDTVDAAADNITNTYANLKLNGSGDGGETAEVTWELDTTTTYEGGGATYTAKINETILNSINVIEFTYDGATYPAKGVLYGVPQTLDESTITKMFSVQNGSVTLTTNSSGKYGTGSLVLIKDSTGAPKAAYYVAYRGDVNGDSSVNVSDMDILKQAIAGINGYSFNSNEENVLNLLPAADIDGNGSYDISDYDIANSAQVGMVTINQTVGGIAE